MLLISQIPRRSEAPVKDPTFSASRTSPPPGTKDLRRGSAISYRRLITFEAIELVELSTIPDSRTATMMADPFEVRMRFTAQLQHLNASVTSSQKAAHYALKYRDMDEDLHSCILEQLERVCLC